jgi:hypothetical protein
MYLNVLSLHHIGVLINLLSFYAFSMMRLKKSVIWGSGSLRGKYGKLTHPHPLAKMYTDKARMARKKSCD